MREDAYEAWAKRKRAAEVAHNLAVRERYKADEKVQATLQELNYAEQQMLGFQTKERRRR